MRLLQALKARQPTTRAVIAKNKVVWWARSVGAAIAGKRGPGEKVGTALLGEAGAAVDRISKLAAECRTMADAEEGRLHGEIEGLQTELARLKSPPTTAAGEIAPKDTDNGG